MTGHGRGTCDNSCFVCSTRSGWLTRSAIRVMFHRKCSFKPCKADKETVSEDGAAAHCLRGSLHISIRHGRYLSASTYHCRGHTWPHYLVHRCYPWRLAQYRNVRGSSQSLRDGPRLCSTTEPSATSRVPLFSEKRVVGRAKRRGSVTPNSMSTRGWECDE